MKAAQINSYGGREALNTVNDAPKPQAGAGQVLVEVYAAGVNPFDLKVREGQTRQVVELKFPATLGGDFAGVIAEVSGDGTGLKVGDEVYGQANALSGQGSFAEFTPVKIESISVKPTSIDFINASAIPLTGVSAYQALVDHAGLKSGQKILIHGGAGGIGSLAIQLAKHIGAYVATTATTADLDFVRNLGADEAIDYTIQDFATLLKNYDVVFDTVGGDTFAKSYTVLNPGGVIVSMVEKESEELAKQYQVRVITQFTQVNNERLTKVAELVNQGVLNVQIDKVFSLDEADEALEYLKAGKHRGKVVIKIKD